MKGQVFTIDLVLGAVIILSIIGSAYSLSAYYSSLSQITISNGNLVSEVSSAITAFVTANSTRDSIEYFQSSSGATAFFTSFTNNITQSLGQELNFPYSISIYTIGNYTNGELVPNLLLFSYETPAFVSGAPSISFYEPIVVTQQTSACRNTCNFSLQAGSIFIGENATLNAAKCNIYSLTGAKLVVGSWHVFNNTPTGYCTLEAPKYPSVGGTPKSYLVKAYNLGGTFIGNTTLHTMGLDLIQIEVQAYGS
jgi:hypothetical protein